MSQMDLTPTTLSPPQSNEHDLSLPPHSVETEEALLGSVMIDPLAFGDVETIIHADDFYIVRHSWIWEALKRLHESSDSIDIITVADDLAKRPDPTGKHKNQLEAIGGRAYINYLPMQVGSALNAETYALIVQRAAIRRQLLSAASEISQLVYDETGDVFQVYAKTLEAVDHVGKRLSDNTVKRPADLAAETIESIMAGHESIVSTSYTTIDQFVNGGLARSRLYLLGGRPGMGKTTLQINMAFNIAYRFNYPVLFISLEMSAEQLQKRMISKMLRLPIERFYQLREDVEMGSRAWSAGAVLADIPLWIKDDGEATPQQIKATALQMRREYGRPPIVFIDHINRARIGDTRLDNSDNENAVITKLATAYKNIAKDLDTAVVCAVQLNRGVENRADKRPALADLRSSGALEQEADVVLFLYRGWYYLTKEQQRSAADLDRIKLETIVAKNRDGRTGSTALATMLEHTAVYNAVWDQARQNMTGIDWSLESALNKQGAETLSTPLPVPIDNTTKRSIEL